MPLFRVIFKILFFVLVSLPLPFTQFILLMFHRGYGAYFIPRMWHTSLCWAFGMRVRTIGTPISPRTPAMFISNHVSYLDILVMGSKIEASFVAKNDVAKWPVFGWLSKLQQTAFISRSAHHALREKHSLQSYLKARKSIIIYPEGTTNDGVTMLPFKSSLFSLALEHDLTNGTLMIQPFSLRILPLPGQDGAEGVAAYPWPFSDDTPMLTHLIRFAKSRGCILELVFHAPIDPKHYTDRKDLCRAVEDVVAKGIKTGQSEPSPTPPQKIEAAS